MYYSIEKTLEFLPLVCWTVIGAVLLVLEVRSIRSRVCETPTPERGGFIPPNGDGYEYYVGNNAIVFIRQNGKGRFRVYVLQGSAPPVAMRRDRHGSYFTVSAADAAGAEHIVDQIYRT